LGRRASGIACTARQYQQDRSGCGASAPGPRPRTSEQIVAEAHALLQARGLAGGPALFVGHSFGGYNTRLMRARHPELVQGLGE
jgi:pimeloyl-ACP methyl ester carboxylesterase